VHSWNRKQVPASQYTATRKGQIQARLAILFESFELVCWKWMLCRLVLLKVIPWSLEVAHHQETFLPTLMENCCEKLILEVARQKMPVAGIRQN
jgi:hypothetical protein